MKIKISSEQKRIARDLERLCDSIRKGKIIISSSQMTLLEGATALEIVYQKAGKVKRS